jgi:osmotically inducible protein OsmC
MQIMPRIERSATATWTGSIARGRGALTAPSGTLVDVPYTVAGRTTPGHVDETNPEELLASAHAGCFAMALAAQLTRRNAPPESLSVTATVALDDVDGMNRIVGSALVVAVSAPVSNDDFADAIVEADGRCPFSALIRDAGGAVSVTTSLAATD